LRTCGARWLTDVKVSRHLNNNSKPGTTAIDATKTAKTISLKRHVRVKDRAPMRAACAS